MRFLICFFLFSLFSSAAPIEITGVAATANGKVVTIKEVRSLMSPTISLLRTKYPRGGEAAEIEFKKAQDAVLEQLIENKIILSKLEDEGAAIPDFVVDQETSRIINEFYGGKEADFRNSLAESGTTMRSFRQTQKEKILVQALKSQQFGQDFAPPTPQEVQAQYNKRKLEYRDRTKDKVTFSRIFIPALTGEPGVTPESQLSKAENLALNLSKGADFSLSAKKYSAGAYAEEGGLWPTTIRSDLEPSLAELLMSADLNKISGPFKGTGGFTIVKVTDKDYGPTPPLSEIRERLIKEVESEKYEEKYRRWMNTLKKKAIIDRRM